MPQVLKQYLRPAVYAYRKHLARRRALTQSPLDEHDSIPITYIVGCGRSGTTILGKLFQQHPNVCYLFEPYHLWAAVHPVTDVTNLYESGDGRLIMRSDFVDDMTRLRFRRTIGANILRGSYTHLIEKTPHNALRIDFLEALSRGARYIHIVRDGIAVAQSIARLAKSNAYRISSRPKLNQWWGENDIKWQTLSEDVKRHNYFAEEVDLLSTDFQRGAFEWLVTMLELRRYRDSLANRIYEVRYEDLQKAPRTTLADLARFTGLEPSRRWLDRGEKEINPHKSYSPVLLELPPLIAAAFNEQQELLGFSARSSIINSDTSPR